MIDWFWQGFAVDIDLIVVDFIKVDIVRVDHVGVDLVCATHAQRRYSLASLGIIHAHKNKTELFRRPRKSVSCPLVAERLSARLLILQCVVSVGGVWL